MADYLPIDPRAVNRIIRSLSSCGRKCSTICARAGSVLFLVLIALILASCGGTTGYEPQAREPIEPTAPVPADGILETVTWNLEWFGDGTYGEGASNGPVDEGHQAKNIVQTLDSLNADLYAFQEVYSQQALADLLQPLTGYKGFVAEHIDWMQKTAFVYNTNTVDSVAAGAIREGQDSRAWANGRFPLYFQFTYRHKNTSHDFYAVVIHAKAFDDRQSYQRRREAARDLYQYLQNRKPEAKIILLGDYNDDVDASIYDDAETPYEPFVSDSAHYEIVTRTLSESGKSSTVSYPDMVDHITMSDELFPRYIEGSAGVFNPSGFITKYASTTSDHYPVRAMFDLRSGSEQAENKVGIVIRP